MSHEFPQQIITKLQFDGLIHLARLLILGYSTLSKCIRALRLNDLMLQQMLRFSFIFFLDFLFKVMETIQYKLLSLLIHEFLCHFSDLILTLANHFNVHDWSIIAAPYDLLLRS